MWREHTLEEDSKRDAIGARQLRLARVQLIGITVPLCVE